MGERKGERLGFLILVTLFAGGCTGSGGGNSDGDDGGGGAPGASGPDPPSDVTLETSNGSVLVDWRAVDEASSYNLHWALAPGVAPGNGHTVQADEPPHVLSGFDAGDRFHVVLTSVGAEGEGLPTAEFQLTVAPGSPDKYFPGWARTAADTTLTFDYDAGRTSAQNGADLKSVMQSLSAGERLEVGSGVYTVDSLFNLSLQGTAEDPIWIVAKEGATPVLTRSNASQNTLNIGSGSPTRYLCLRGFEITGGDIALRLYDCDNVWIDECHIHDCDENAIAANSDDTDALYFTQNHIHDTNGYGEGIYLGGNNGNPIASNCVIALNHVHDTGGSQGDGIEVKQGSWGNWIAENVVHDTNYPCILVYGTDGETPNLVERNVCWNSGDNVMQVQGEAIVRNNVLMAGANGFASSDHQGQTRDLVFVHNTVVNAGTGARLSSWNGRPGMVFANNTVYSESGSSIYFPNGSNGVEIAGNVVVGSVNGVGSGYSLGNGLADFTDVSWDAQDRDVTPAPLGALIDTGHPQHAALEDLHGALRLPPLESGAVDAP